MSSGFPARPSGGFLGRRHRQRPRRARRRLRLGRARPPRHPLRQERLARRQGRGLARGRLPLRHGADHPHGAPRAGADFFRGRPRHQRLPRSAPPRPAMALLLRRRHPDRPDAGRRHHGGGDGPLRARRRRGRGLQEIPLHLGAPARCVRKVLLLEAGRGPVRHDQHPGEHEPRHPAGRAELAHARLGRQHHPRQGEGRPPRPDARPLRAVCRLLALRRAGGALRHRPHADGGRGLVPDGRHPRGGRGAGQARGRARRDPEARLRGDGARHRERHRARRAHAGRHDRLRRRDLQHGLGADLPGTRRRRGRPGLREEEPRARLLGRGALSGAQQALRAPEPPRLRLLARSREEFDWIYRRGEPAPDPTAYLAAPSSTDPSVAPEGGEALYVLVHTPYLRPHHDWSKMFPAYRR